MLKVSSDFTQILALIFGSAWKIATSFNIPGTNMNIIEFSIAALVLAFIFRHPVKWIAPHFNTSNIDSSASDTHSGSVSKSSSGSSSSYTSF